MKYTCAYKTSDGQRHEATLEAASREVAFSALRAQGIKPIKVAAADGSKANGEIVVKGVRRRVVTIIVAVVALIVGALAFGLGRGGSTSRPPRGDESGGLVEAALPFLNDTTRRQVIGDAAVIEKGIRTGWADVFDREGDRFLASFAIPGVKAGVRAVSVAALEEVLNERSPHRGDPTKPNGRATSMTSPQGIEARQIIAMVNGMKAARDSSSRKDTVEEAD